MKTPQHLGIEYEILDLEGDLEGEPTGPARPRRIVPDEIAFLSGGLFDGAPRVDVPLDSFFPPELPSLAAPRAPRVDCLLPPPIPRSDSLVPLAVDTAPPSAEPDPMQSRVVRWSGLLTATAVGVILGTLVMRTAAPAAQAGSTPKDALLAANLPALTTLTPEPASTEKATTTAKSPAEKPVLRGKLPVRPEARAAGVPVATAAVAVTAPEPTATAPDLTMVLAPPAPPPPDPLHRPEPVQGVAPQRAAIAIAAAGRGAAGCLAADDLRRTMAVTVTFAPSGRATRATISGGPHRGTAAGSCIAQALRSATVAPFEGSPVTVSTSVVVR